MARIDHKTANRLARTEGEDAAYVVYYNGGIPAYFDDMDDADEFAIQTNSLVLDYATGEYAN